MRRWTAFVLGMMLAVTAAGAGELAGVSLPDQVTVGGKTLVLNGMGLRKKMVIKVYVAGLYLEERSADPAAIVGSSSTKRVVMHFLTGMATKSKMDAAWSEGFQANSPDVYPALADRVTTFMGFFGDMKDGDEIVLTVVPGAGTTVALNGQEKGTIAGDDFGTGLLKVWLGDHPPSVDLKAGLLGK
jgi:Chalcone isomerase-like